MLEEYTCILVCLSLMLMMADLPSKQRYLDYNTYVFHENTVPNMLFELVWKFQSYSHVLSPARINIDSSASL